MAKDTALSFRVPAEMKEALERAAKADMRSVSSLVEKVLTEWLRANGHLQGGAEHVLHDRLTPKEARILKS